MHSGGLIRMKTSKKGSSHHSFNLHLHASCSQMITQKDEHHPALFRYKHHKEALNNDLIDCCNGQKPPDRQRQ
jgi:hypothetical protein